jgi:acyl carrier protein
MKPEKIMPGRREVTAHLNRRTLLTIVIATIESLVQDWDIAQPIDAGTRLVADLGFESIDLIQMVSALEQEFGRPTVSFAEMLVVDGRYVDDLTVGQIAEAVAARVLPDPAAR